MGGALLAMPEKALQRARSAGGRTPRKGSRHPDPLHWAESSTLEGDSASTCCSRWVAVGQAPRRPESPMANPCDQFLSSRIVREPGLRHQRFHREEHASSA